MKHYYAIVTFLLIASAAMGISDYYVENYRTEVWTTPPITVHISSTTNDWRFTYSDTNLVCIPFVSDGETWTQDNIVECGNLGLAKSNIVERGLYVTPEQQEEIDRLVEVFE